jgi:subtilisin family serine protease
MTRLIRRPERVFAALLTALAIAVSLGLYPVLGAGQEGGAVPNPGRVIPLHPVGAVPGQYIVVFDEGVTDPRGLTQALAQRHGFAIRHSYAFALKGFAARMPVSVAQALADDPDVDYVEPDLFVHAAAQTIPTGVSRIGGDLNAIANVDGNDDRVDVDIAIIDTGIDRDHPDLNVLRGVKWVSFPSLGCSSKGRSGDDDNGHGSHVAGIAAAVDNGFGVVGVAPGARLWPVKVLDCQGYGVISDIVKGIDYVTSHASDIEVANMSLTAVGSSDALWTAIQNSVAAGVVHVAAAGNRAVDIYGVDGFGTDFFGLSDDTIPAAYPEVAAVSAIGDTDGDSGGSGSATSRGTADDTFAEFSNFSGSELIDNPVNSQGLAIDLAAPGVDIYSTWRGGGYKTFSGTSMAAPHVTGAVALEIAANGRANNAADVASIRQTLIDSAESQADWGPAQTGDLDDNPEGLVNVMGDTQNVNAAPVVTITSPSDGAQFSTGALITFEGSASDAEDGDLTSNVVWISDWDGNIGTGGSVSTNSLSTNMHVITASVTDLGSKSDNRSIMITVGDPPPQATLVEVTDVTAGTEGGKNGQKHVTVLVALADNLGVPVSGALVTLVLNHADGTWSGTGSTASNGTVKFSRKNAPSGCHTGEVTEVAAQGLTWNNDSPQDQVCKP